MIKDPIAKYKRIQQLGDMGFNTPRMLHCPAGYILKGLELTELLNNIDCVAQGYANIRTYSRAEDSETFLSKHYIKEDRHNVAELVSNLTLNGVECMVDIENPDNGLYAGSIQIFNDIESSFTIDYCYEPNRAAMVRNADINVQGKWKTRKCLPLELQSVVEACYEMFNLLYRSVVIEFSCLKFPAGIKDQYTMYWEYRNLQK